MHAFVSYIVLNITKLADFFMLFETKELAGYLQSVELTERGGVAQVFFTSFSSKFVVS